MWRIVTVWANRAVRIDEMGFFEVTIERRRIKEMLMS